ncbi:MAG: M18 family aminopeptidase [Zetaproteobacteria bacterium]|nr:M18 family aminopeptidase [Zetaproteobacteria bacterium]
MVMDCVAEYIQFQKASPTPYHVVATLESMLQQAAFRELHWEDPSWELLSGQGYYIKHPDLKAIIPVVLGTSSPVETGFLIAAAHTDSPNLRLRFNPLQQDEVSQMRGLVQVHGGIIARSWLDRPMELAGCLFFPSGSMEKNGLPHLAAQLVRTSHPVGVIPDLAIHLDREKNRGTPCSLENALHVMLGLAPQGSKDPWETLKTCFGMESDSREPRGFDLQLAPYGDHVVCGMRGEYLTGPRHDDLAMVYAVAYGLSQSLSIRRAASSIAIFCDAEETGSLTSSGAESMFIRDVLRRIAISHPSTLVSHYPAWCASLAKSFLVSADMAHAYHPAYPDRHDSQHRLQIGGGLVIKENANDRYATSAYTSAVVQSLCEEQAIPVQGYVHRQDMGCGSTVGPTLAANLGCRVADIGTAMWAMHSTGETMATQDLTYACRFFQHFFSNAA